MRNLQVTRPGCLEDAGQEVVTVGVIGRNDHGAFQSLARFVEATLRLEDKAQHDARPGILRIGFRPLPVTALGIGVTAGLDVLVTLALDGQWRWCGWRGRSG